MNLNYHFRYPTVLTIAGSDSSGGAGIQADIKTLSALGVYGASAITAITAQSTVGVRGIQAISSDILHGQIEAVMEDFQVDAVKIGMLHNQQAIQVVADALKRFSPSWSILDPVMISTSGNKLLEEAAIHFMIKNLFPLASLVTPNIDEAEYISGILIRDEEDMIPVAEQFFKLGCQAVLLKGGHLKSDNMTDLLFRKGYSPIRFSTPTISSSNTHGTGCSLSSAIAAFLARKYDLPDAVGLAKKYITEAIQKGMDVQMGKGHGPMNHFFAPLPLYKIEREA